MGFVGIATMGDEVGAQQAWGEDALVLDALRRRGLDARHVAWTEPDAAWDGASLCVIRTVWDYTRRPDAFLAWTRHVESLVPTWNPPALVRWNAHKSYLFELEARGVRLPPTWRVPRGGTLDLAPLLRAHGALVLKPIVDVGALGAMRADGTASLEAAQAHLAGIVREGEALVQPFLRSVVDEGELSLVFLGGRYSHAVRKVPRRGDYRVQASWGGTSAPAEPTAAEHALARRALDALPAPTLHARVDLVRDNDGHPALMELEAIEPFLFLDAADGAADRYAAAIEARLRD